MRARSTLEWTVSPPRLVCSSSSSSAASLDASSISSLSFLHDSCATPPVNRCSSPTIDRVPSTLSSHTVSKPQSRAPKRLAPPRLSRLRRRRETRRSISSAFDPRARVEASSQSIPISRISSLIVARRLSRLSPRPVFRASTPSPRRRSPPRRRRRRASRVRSTRWTTWTRETRETRETTRETATSGVRSSSPSPVPSVPLVEVGPSYESSSHSPTDAWRVRASHTPTRIPRSIDLVSSSSSPRRSIRLGVPSSRYPVHLSISLSIVSTVNATTTDRPTDRPTDRMECVEMECARNATLSRECLAIVSRVG